MGWSVYSVVGDEAGDTYPVVDGRLRRHPGLRDPKRCQGNVAVQGGEDLSYCSGSLNPNTVDPSGKVDAAAKKALRTFHGHVR